MILCKAMHESTKANYKAKVTWFSNDMFILKARFIPQQTTKENCHRTDMEFKKQRKIDKYLNSYWKSCRTGFTSNLASEIWPLWCWLCIHLYGHECSIDEVVCNTEKMFRKYFIVICMSLLPNILITRLDFLH